MAGTPLVPTFGFLKPTGHRALLGADIGLIHDAGFYGLDALTIDVHVGVRSQSKRLEWHGTVGPTTILGSDGDGTPYVAAGVQATVGATWWLVDRVGLMESATGRVRAAGDTRYSPGAMIGLVLRRKPVT